MQEGFFTTVYRICERIMYLAYINLLWLFFSIIGLGILGFFPATTAMFAVTRQQIRNEKVPTFKMYSNYFKQDFWQANLTGWIFVPIGFLLYLNFSLLALLEGYLVIVMSVILISITALYLLLTFFVFPVFVHYDLTLRNYIVLSITIMFSQPTHAVLIGIVSIMYVYLIYHVPALMPFVGMSLWGFLMTHITQDAFKKSHSTLET